MYKNVKARSLNHSSKVQHSPRIVNLMKVSCTSSIRTGPWPLKLAASQVITKPPDGGICSLYPQCGLNFVSRGVLLSVLYSKYNLKWIP